MKKVLIIVFEFPPLGSGGVIRCTKYVKYLRSFGWEPVILTIDERSQPDSPRDYSLLQELPDDLEIHRTPYVDFDDIFQKEVHSSILLNVYQSIDSNFPGIFGFAKPDKNITWFPHALEKANEIVKKGGIDLIYTDSPPNSTALLGYKLKETFGIPWVADFRDPWSLDDLAYENLGDRYHQGGRKLDMLLERIIMEKCDRIIVVSEKLRQNYLDHLEFKRDQISVIANGYDEDDFKNITAIEDNKQVFKIKYMGSFYGSYNPTVFLEALHGLITKHQIDDIRFYVIGHGSHWIRQNLERLNLNELEPFLDLEGHIESKQCLAKMLDSDLLLAVSPSKIDYNVPQKIYAYMRIGIPIFAVMPENGEAVKIIRTSNAGYVVGADSVDRVEQKLHELYLLWKQDSLTHNQDQEFITRFERRPLTRRLADLFNNICQAHNEILEEIILKGENFFKDCKYKEALEVFKDALDLKPLSTETLNNLGVVSFQLHNHEKALEYFIKALEIDPTDKDSLVNIYSIYRALNLKNDAEEILRQLHNLFGEETFDWIS